MHLNSIGAYRFTIKLAHGIDSFGILEIIVKIFLYADIRIE